MWSDPLSIGIQDTTSRQQHAMLLRAVQEGNIQRIKDLLNSQIDINQKDGGGSGLHYAARLGQESIIRHLLDRGASINSRTNTGQTPLHKACLSGQHRVVSLLLRRGADASLIDNDDQTAFDIATNENFTECIAAFENPENSTLRLPHYSQGKIIELNIDIEELERIRLEHVINLTVSEDSTVSAISAEGLELLRTIDDKLDRVSLLLSMTNDNRIDENFKLELFYGLLFDLEGLTIVKENGQIIAPTPELKITVPIPRGSIEFLVKVRGDVLTQAPDISFFCHRKAECRYSVREIICFLLHELRNLPPEETLMTVFRMKSYSSVINKLLYRGKGLSDLFATTILDSDYNELIRKIESRGGMCVHERQEKQINGNRCIVSRYVRILKIQFENSQDYFFCPIYYEIVLDNLMPPAVSHQQYELERLKFKLSAGAQNLIQQKGFTIHQCSR